VNDGSWVLTLKDVRGGLVLLEAAGAAVFLPELPALHIPTDRNQISRVLANPLASGSMGMTPCRFRRDGIHQLNLMRCELHLLIPA
jgi:hypothetical protein